MKEFGMNESPKALRLHIGLFGRRNAGKSSLLNALVGQDVAIVSPTPGSTADPVEKTLEMAPLGPVVFLDTAGLDDRDASLGAQRVERSLRAMRRVDVALLVLDADADRAFCQSAAQTETKESLLAAMEADSTLSPALKQAVIKNVLKGRFFD